MGEIIKFRTPDLGVFANFPNPFQAKYPDRINMTHHNAQKNVAFSYCELGVANPLFCWSGQEF